MDKYILESFNKLDYFIFPVSFILNVEKNLYKVNLGSISI